MIFILAEFQEYRLKNHKRLLLWFITFLYAVFIFYLSSLPDVGPDWDFPFKDKIGHFCLFGGLGILFYLSYKNEKLKMLSSNAFAWANFSTFLYGITDEIHQLFVPNRHFDIVDILMDLAGALVLTSLMRAMKKLKTL